jgi:pyruvate kinase
LSEQLKTTKRENFKNTKILATLGPATQSKEVIIDLISGGIDGVRLNFSHGDYDFYEQIFRNVDAACVSTSEPIAILIDLQGPKIRVGELIEAFYLLKENDRVTITTENIVGTAAKFSCSYEGLARDAKAGDSIYIDDGLIKLVVVNTTDKEVECVVLEGGILKPRKGINLPGMNISQPSLTEKDYKDLEFALKRRVDFIALSFVRKAEDVIELRRFLEAKGLNKNIIAKIEKPEAVSNIDSIIDTADGIMVARGDLGVEMPPQEVPIIQKSIISKCNRLGKMVITATQMLESMVNNPVPTRAETSDVANAVWDGTDVVMLSAETSVGKYPVETVEMMHDILVETERHLDYIRKERAPIISIEQPRVLGVYDSVGSAVANMAVQLEAEAVASFTQAGRMARAMSKFRPVTKIIALSDSFEIMNILSLIWGIIPIYFVDRTDDYTAIKDAVKLLKEKNLVHEGSRIIFTAGSPPDEKGKDIWIKLVKA